MLSKWMVFFIPILLLSGKTVNVLHSPPTFEIDVTIAASCNVSGSNENEFARCSSMKLIVVHPDIDPNDNVNKLPIFRCWRPIFSAQIIIFNCLRIERKPQKKKTAPKKRKCTQMQLTTENHNKLSNGWRKQIYVIHVYIWTECDADETPSDIAIRSNIGTYT